MLLRLDCGIQALSLLTSYAGLAVCRAIEDCCGLSPQIKWPNDLILDGKKVCGILTRSVSDAETGQLSCALIGIGINVHQTVFPDDLRDKAISLTMSGVSCSRSHLAAALLRELDRIFLKERWLQNPPDSAINELRRRSCTIGREVLVISPLGKEQAKAVDIASDGGLVLQTAQGIRTITSGEVSVHGILGYLPE